MPARGEPARGRLALRALVLFAAVGCDPLDDRGKPSDDTGPRPEDSAAQESLPTPDSADTADTAPPTETGDTAVDTADDTDTAEPAVDPTPDATGPVPTMADPFVVDGCGFQDGTIELFPVPDLDGDGEEDLLVVVPDTPEVYGTWLVPGGSATMPYWDQPTHWDADGDAQTVPDLDGDGIPEVYLVRDGAVTRLAPDGSTPTWTGVPTAILPWRDVDGDGVDDLVVGASALSADGTTVGYVAVVAALDPDPSTWTALATVTGDGLGVALTAATADHDGDGIADLFVTDATDGHLLSSAVLEAGGTLADAALATFPGVSGRVAVAIGDVDGGGTEDVAFPPPAS